MIYKLIFDIDVVDCDNLFENFASMGFDLCWDTFDNNLYLYDKIQHQRHISNIMKENKIQNYFIQELKNAPTKTPTNYVQTWLLEKFQEQEMAKFNEQHQAELKKAQENIKKAQEKFLKIITEYNQTNQGGAADGK